MNTLTHSLQFSTFSGYIFHIVFYFIRLKLAFVRFFLTFCKIRRPTATSLRQQHLPFTNTNTWFILIFFLFKLNWMLALFWFDFDSFDFYTAQKKDKIITAIIIIRSTHTLLVCTFWNMKLSMTICICIYAYNGNL